MQPAACMTAEGVTLPADRLTQQQRQLVDKMHRWSYYKQKELTS